jgi:hypothetical protein
VRWHRYCKRWQMAKATVGSGISMVVASYPGLGLAISAVDPAYSPTERRELNPNRTSAKVG